MWLSTHHPQELYLGAKRLRAFGDARIYDFWTSHPLPERLFMPWANGTDDGPSAYVNSSTPLWNMLNKYLVHGAVGLGWAW